MSRGHRRDVMDSGRVIAVGTHGDDSHFNTCIYIHSDVIIRVLIAVVRARWRPVLGRCVGGLSGVSAVGTDLHVGMALLQLIKEQNVADMPYEH